MTRIRYFARLARNLSASHLGTHRARLLLSAMGVAAGVALVVSMTGLATSINASLDGMIAASATRADLEIRGASGIGIPETVVADVAAVPGVRVAGGTIESYTRLRRGPETARALLIGLDAGAVGLAPRAATEGAEIVDPSGIVLTRSVARSLGAGLGDSIEIATPHGWRPAIVGGLQHDLPGGLEVAAGALPVVQQLVGRDGLVDAVYLDTDDPAAVTPAVEAAVHGRGRVGPPGITKRDVGRVIEGTSGLLGGATLVALFVGMLLVHNTMSMAAVERFREAAILRAIGASRRHVVLLFLAEAALIGAVGAVVGVGIGAVIAEVAMATRRADIEQLFPVAFTGTTLRARDLLGGASAGLLVALLAAALPARRIARAEPAVALGEEATVVDPTIRSRRGLTIVGVILSVGGLAFGVTVGVNEPARGLAGLMVMLLGIAIVIPTALPLLAQTVAARVERASWSRRYPIGRLAAAELARSPRRTAFTTAAVLLAVMMFISFAAALASFSSAFKTGVDAWLRADIYARATIWRPLGAATPLDAGVAERIKAVPGVHDAFSFRITTLSLQGETVTIQTWPFQAMADNIDDLSPEYRRILRAQGADELAASTSYLRTLGAKVGDSVTLPGPSGAKTFRIAESYDDLSAFLPILYMDLDAFTSFAQTAQADSFVIFTEPGADAARVQREIERSLGSQYDLVVESADQFRARLTGIAQIQEQLVSLIQGVALVIAGLAISNTLLISLFQRRREIGVLRAVGMQRTEVSKLITAEAMFMAALGVVLGVLVGVAAGYALHLALEGIVGSDLAMTIPSTLVLAAVALGLGLAAVASLYPARRAASVNMLTAVQYE